MVSRIPRWFLAVCLGGLATDFARTEEQPAAKAPRTEKTADDEASIKELREELAKIKAEVERLKREAARNQGVETDGRLRLLKTVVGDPAQTTDLRPGEALRFAWRNEMAFSPAISPDGRWGYVSGGTGMMPRLLDLQAGVERLLVKPAQPMSVRGFFSPDSRLLGLLFINGEVEIFDLVEGKRRTPFSIRLAVTGLMGGAAFTPDSKQILIAAGDSLRLVDVAEGQEVRRIPPGMESVRSITLSSDGKFVACAGGSFSNSQAALSDTIRIIELKSEDVRFRITPPVRTIGTYGAVLPDNDRVLTLQSNRLSVFTMAGNKELLNLPISSGAFAVAPSADGRFVAVVGIDKGLQIWDLKSGRQRHIFMAENAGFQGVAWTKDGKQILTASRDGTARLWNVPDLPEQDSTKLPPPAAMLIEVRPVTPPPAPPDGSSIRQSSANPLPVGISALEQAESLQVPAGQSGIQAIAWLAGGEILTLGKAGPRLTNLQTRKSEAFGSDKDAKEMAVRSFAVSPDGRQVVFGGGEPGGPARVSIWDLRRREELRKLEGHTLAVPAVAISANGKTVAAASEDKSILLWDAESGKVKQKLLAHHPVESLVFAPDEKELVNIDSIGSANFWDLKAGKIHHSSGGGGKPGTLIFAPDSKSYFVSYAGPFKAVSQFQLNPWRPLQQWSGRGTAAMALSRDGSCLAIGSTEDDEEVVYLWQMAQARFSATFRLGKGPAVVLAFSPDGRQLVVGGTDEHLHIWDVPVTTAPPANDKDQEKP